MLNDNHLQNYEDCRDKGTWEWQYINPDVDGSQDKYFIDGSDEVHMCYAIGPLTCYRYSQTCESARFS